jgi:choline dehydrogenase-like flavoprotein
MPARPYVVIVGAGFGGLNAAKALAGAEVDITVIDRRNYHLFQPLLYQVATAGLSPAEIAMPIRAILRRQQNAKVLLGRVTGIDKAAREVEIGERRIGYDVLIVATGARHAYFGHAEWEPHAPGLKKIEHATDIRRKILIAFERAETSADPQERRRLLNFVIVGGGPDRGRACRRHCRARPQGARRRFPQYRSKRRARHPNRGASAAACQFPANPVGGRDRDDLRPGWGGHRRCPECGLGS